MNTKTALILTGLLGYLLTTSTAYCQTPPATFIENPAVEQFIDKMVQKHDFDKRVLTHWFKQATLQPAILESIAKPAESLTWKRYQRIFLTPQRVTEGVAFWRQHAATLQKAETQFGVPPEIITAIIGVETFYGKHKGGYKVLDALSTLAFAYPPRSAFFLSELEAFLLLTKEEGWDPTTIMGSYAGAMGTPQFIASSYRRYAIDFTQDGKRDLLQSPQDAIGSVANYFKVHGWQPRASIAYPAHVTGERFKSDVASKKDPKPRHNLAHWTQLGVHSALKSTDLNRPLALIALEGNEGPEYWLGTQNFYTITRYNHSDLYAMSVYQLSEQIKTAYLKEE